MVQKMKLKPGMNASGHAKALFMLVLLTVCGSSVLAHADWKPRNYLMKTDPEHATGLYTKDPNVWVYTPEFAKRFAMPEKWATDELKGAQAIAYRIRFNREETCGWFRDPNACRNNYACVMDIYTDHDAGLPWEPDAPPMGVRALMSDKSVQFLSPQKRSDDAKWDQVNNRPDERKSILGIASRSLLTGKPKRGKSYSGISVGPTFMNEYVRNVYPGLDYFNIGISCLLYEHPHNVRLRFSDNAHIDELSKNETQAYEIRIPYSFVQRMAEYMKVRYEGRSIWDDVKKRRTVK